MTLLQVTSVSHSFLNQGVLSQVSLSVGKGEIVCLLGPSGSGKTTLLKIIAGLLTPTSGTIHVNGTDQASIPTYRRDIGFVFQSPTALFPHLSVFDNVAFPFTRGRRTPPNGDWKAAVFSMLHAVRLDEFAHKSIATLSGGQRQRVALARALVYEPALLLLDEPLSSLDNRLKEQLLDLMEVLHQITKTTFIYVTHDEREALKIATHIAVLDSGRLQQFSSTENVSESPSNRRVAEIIAGWSLISVQIDQTNEKRERIVLPGNINFLATCKLPTRSDDVQQIWIALLERRLSFLANKSAQHQDFIYLDATITELRSIRGELLVKSQLPDGQTINCRAPADRSLSVGTQGFVAFRKDDIHVLTD